MAEVIDRLGSSEKSITKNYEDYLKFEFDGWRELSQSNAKTDDQIEFKNGDTKIIIKLMNEYTDEVKEIHLINDFEKTIIKLNRRKNATLFKIYDVNTGIHIRDDYRDGQGRVYLSYFFNKRDKIFKYELIYLNKKYSFKNEDQLIDFLNSYDDKIDYQKQIITLDKIVYDQGNLVFRDPLLKETQAIEILDQGGNVVYQRELNDVLQVIIKISTINTLFNQTELFKFYLTFKGIKFNLRQKKLVNIPINDRFFLVNETIELATYLGYNVQQHLIVKTEPTENYINNVMVSGSPLFVSDIRENEQSVYLVFNLIKFSHPVFFQKINGQEIKIEFEFENQNKATFKFKKNSWNDEQKIYIRYKQQTGAYQQKLISFNHWFSQIIKNSQINLATTEHNLRLNVNSVNWPENMMVTLAIRNRGSKEVIYIETKPKQENDQYTSYVIDNHQMPFTPKIGLDDYDPTIYDVLFRLDYTGITSGQFHARGKWNETILEEIPSDFEDNWKIIFNPYPTSNHQELSIRTYFINNDSWSYYQKLKQDRISIRHKNHRPKLIIVEAPNRAQDNGLAFFKYMMNLPNQPFDVKYLLTKYSSDWKNLLGYEQNTIIYKSKEHFEFMKNVDVVIHTNSSFYAYPINTSFWQKYQKRVKKVFLQHGIMGVRDLSKLYGRNEMFTNRYIVSSIREKQIAVKKMGYRPYEVVITGLSRFDNLLAEHKEWSVDKIRNRILIMPSWRKGQDRLSDEDFMLTDFYKNLYQLLNDPSFISLIQSKHLKLNLYLHHNFQRYNHLFQELSINVINEFEINVQELLISHALLITDFSSVALDFALQNRPVFYYQLDDSLIQQLPQVKTLFPGEIYWDINDLCTDITLTLDKDNLAVAEPKKLENLYLQRDTHANERIFALIVSLLNNKENFKQLAKYQLRQLIRQIKRKMHRIL